MSGPTIAIIEPNATGHRMYFAGHIAQAALQAGVLPTIITDRVSVEMKATLEVMGRLQGKVPIHGIPDLLPTSAEPNPLRAEAICHARMKRLTNELRASGFDQFFVSYMDTCSRAIAAFGSPFGSVPFSGLVMRPAFQYASMGVRAPVKRHHRIDEWLFRRLLNKPTLQTLWTIDPTLHGYATRHHLGGANRLRYVADPVDLATPPPDSRAFLGLPEDGKLLLLYGNLDARKGMTSLLEAAARPTFPPGVTLVFAGGSNPEGDAILASADAIRARDAGRLITRIGFQTDLEQAALFHACDAVWLGYHNHFGSSGVLGQAAAAGKPVIATEQGLIGWETENGELGVTVDSNDPESIALGVDRLFNTPTDSWSNALHRFANLRSLTAFVSTIQQGFEASGASA